MKLSRRKFSQLGLGGLAAVALSSALVGMFGCAAIPAATFIQMGLQIIGTVAPTIPGIIAAFGALTGKTLTTAQTAKLTSIFNGIGDLFSQANQALLKYQANPSPSLLTDVTTIITSIKTSLSSVLTDVQITDPATLAKVTSIVNSFADLATNLLSILPAVTGGKVQARRVSAQQMARVRPEVWAQTFNQKVGVSSGNTEVDAAFTNVKALVPAEK